MLKIYIYKVKIFIRTKIAFLAVIFLPVILLCNKIKSFACFYSPLAIEVRFAWKNSYFDTQIVIRKFAFIKTFLKLDSTTIFEASVTSFNALFYSLEATWKLVRVPLSRCFNLSWTMTSFRTERFREKRERERELLNFKILCRDKENNYFLFLLSGAFRTFYRCKSYLGVTKFNKKGVIE